MTKTDRSGFGKVYSFTLSQLIKSRANIISLVILLVFALLSVPISSLFSGSSGSFFSSGFEGTVSVKNETGVDIGDVSLLGQGYGELEKASFFEWSDDAPKADLMLTLGKNDGGYFVKLAGNADMVTSGVITNAASSRLRSALLEASGVSAADIAKLSKSVYSYSESQEDFFSDKTDRFGISYFFSMIVMMLGVYSAAYIIRTVAEEKVSKLVELLMVSVDPDALVLGKVFAVLTYVVGTMAAMICCFGASYLISGLFMDVSGVSATAAAVTGSLSNVSAATVAVSLVSVILGVLSFALISGLVGAGCSTMEDTGTAMAAPLIIIMACYMVSTFASFGKPSPVISLIPFLSSFTAPVQFLAGNISLGLLIVSWLIQCAVIALLLFICGKVYRDLLIYNGSRVKLTKIISSAFSRKKGGETK